MDRFDSPVSPRSVPSVTSSLSSAPDSIDLQLESKSGLRKKTRKKVIYFWTSDDVNKWMKKHCGQYYEMYAQVFKEHDISGRTVVGLTDTKLQLLGITDAFHREEIMTHILRLKLKTEKQEIASLGLTKGISYEKKT